MAIFRYLLLIVTLLPGLDASAAGTYTDALAEWRSYEDVARWLDANFIFDKARQNRIGMRLRAQGPSGLLARQPAALYEVSSRGYCADAANFAIHALNEIDPAYNARWVFIANSRGRPNHWVAAFDHDDRIYIMDYGTGESWQGMRGVHGPYKTLAEYRDYLETLDIPQFAVGEVLFREMPGQPD